MSDYRMPAYERYRRDPMFNALVRLLLAELGKANFTPTELREAVIVAATIHEENTVRSNYLHPPSGGAS